MAFVDRRSLLKGVAGFSVADIAQSLSFARSALAQGGKTIRYGMFTRRCLAIVVARRLRSDDVLHCLTDLMTRHGPPEHIRSDNGPEFVAKSVRSWLERIGVKTLYIEPGSP